MAAALTGKRLLKLNAISTDLPAEQRQKLIKKIEQQERAAAKAKVKYDTLRQEKKNLEQELVKQQQDQK
jgi:hypothetical protein